MKNQYLLSILTAILCSAAVTGAQESSVNSSDPNEIFNSMMQTMPDAMKSRVDSASSIQRFHKESSVEKSLPSVAKIDPAAMSDPKQASLDKLPEAVREQVRRTMQELESENNERMLQFKEIQNRKGNK